MRRTSLAVLTLLATLALAAPAGAAGWHTYSLYDGSAPVEQGTGTHSVRLTSMLLPDSFKVRRHATSLTFGRVGACQSTGVIRPALLASGLTTSGAVLAQQLTGGTTYGFGTRGAASYRVRKYSGGTIKAVFVGPTRLAGIWVVVRATTTTHTGCHTGGVRESLGYPLADAFGTIRANGY
jgi:hypothetical protein